LRVELRRGPESGRVGRGRAGRRGGARGPHDPGATAQRRGRRPRASPGIRGSGLETETGGRARPGPRGGMDIAREACDRELRKDDVMRLLAMMGMMATLPLAGLFFLVAAAGSSGVFDNSTPDARARDAWLAVL